MDFLETYIVKRRESLIIQVERFSNEFTPAKIICEIILIIISVSLSIYLRTVYPRTNETSSKSSDKKPEECEAEDDYYLQEMKAEYINYFDQPDELVEYFFHSDYIHISEENQLIYYVKPSGVGYRLNDPLPKAESDQAIEMLHMSDDEIEESESLFKNTRTNRIWFGKGGNLSDEYEEWKYFHNCTSISGSENTSFDYFFAQGEIHEILNSLEKENCVMKILYGYDKFSDLTQFKQDTYNASLLLDITSSMYQNLVH
eukprot:maker-scaffold_36-snap-gene-1.1-mRNA-1 protein AED:0.04 eAED:0.04 QI:38/1/1/1/1/1/5/106/257